MSLLKIKNKNWKVAGRNKWTNNNKTQTVQFLESYESYPIENFSVVITSLIDKSSSKQGWADRGKAIDYLEEYMENNY